MASKNTPDAIAGPLVPSYDPETGLYTWTDDYGESIAEKIAEDQRNLKGFAWVTENATDEKFPDKRAGTLVRTGRVQCFRRKMSQDGLGELVTSEGKFLAGPKELIDFSRAFPRPTLDKNMPLVAAGQFWLHPHDLRSYLYLCMSRDKARRGLKDVWLFPNSKFDDCWWYLILE